jgi:hypothetical protein
VTKLIHSPRRASRWRPGRAPAPGTRPEVTGGQAFICPRCGAKITGPTDSQLGYCAACGDFTGLCAAGRFATYIHVMNAQAWHRPCTNSGVHLWEITVAGTVRRVLLCTNHSAQACDGRAPWVNGASTVGDHSHG